MLARAARSVAAAPHRCRVGAPLERGRPASAVGTRPSSRRARRAHDRRARRRRRRSSRRTSPRLSRTGCPESCPRRDGRSAAFDAVMPAFPRAPRRDPRSSAALYLRGSARTGRSSPACGRRRRSARVLVVRPIGRAVARSRARRGRPRRRERDGARYRRRRASRSARGRWADRRRARMRDRPRLSGGARRARTADRRARASSSPSTSPGSSPRRGDFLLGTGSSPVSAGDARGRGARAQRRADHCRLRARGGARGARSARRDHELALGRNERVAPVRRDACDVF